MARIWIQDEQREISDVAEMGAFLAQFGIWYEKWPVEGRIGEEATNEEILAAYAPEVKRLSERGGFVTADVIAVNSNTPNLDVLLAKFAKEHTHSEDEVRFTVKGGGIFHIHPNDGPVFAVQVEAGDLINVPNGTQHWFDLCSDKQIRCIRLFQDPSGWTPHYIDNSVHERYEPICFGPQYVKAEGRPDNVVKL